VLLAETEIKLKLNTTARELNQETK